MNYIYYQNLANILAEKKRDLGISEARIAELSSVSQPTVHRILSGKHERAAWNDLVEIAGVLGIKINIDFGRSPSEMLDDQAQMLAEAMTGITIATNQMEGQGVSGGKRNQLLKETKNKLLAGPKGKLWLEE